jgi:hypothetical protein
MSVSRSSAPKKDEGVSWRMIGVGAGLVAAGLVADLVPGSGRNERLDALDFLPVGLYGVGGILLVVGVF